MGYSFFHPTMYGKSTRYYVFVLEIDPYFDVVLLLWFNLVLLLSPDLKRKQPGSKVIMGLVE